MSSMPPFVVDFFLLSYGYAAVLSLFGGALFCLARQRIRRDPVSRCA
jgi:hypothetical protein